MLVMMVNFALSIYGLELPPPKPTVTAGPQEVEELTVEVYAPVGPIQGSLDAMTFGLTATPPTHRIRIVNRNK